MKKISLALIVAMMAAFAVSSVAAADKAAAKKCLASARGKKGSDSKACMKLKGAEKKECRKKADEAFEAAKAACAA